MSPQCTLHLLCNQDTQQPSSWAGETVWSHSSVPGKPSQASRQHTGGLVGKEAMYVLDLPRRSSQRCSALMLCEEEYPSARNRVQSGIFRLSTTCCAAVGGKAVVQTAAMRLCNDGDEDGFRPSGCTDEYCEAGSTGSSLSPRVRSHFHRRSLLVGGWVGALLLLSSSTASVRLVPCSL